MKKTIIFVAFLFCSFLGQAQDIVVYDKYQELEKAFVTSDDTLYVINFWATWCGPCVKELPYFETLFQETKGQKVIIILVSLDFKDQLQTKLKSFVEKKKYSSQIVALTDKDYNTWLPEVNIDWSGSIPATLLIKGNKRKFVEKDFTSATELKEFIHSFNNP